MLSMRCYAMLWYAMYAIIIGHHALANLQWSLVIAFHTGRASHGMHDDMRCNTMLCNALLCYAMLCYTIAKPCYAMLENSCRHSRRHRFQNRLTIACGRLWGAHALCIIAESQSCSAQHRPFSEKAFQNGFPKMVLQQDQLCARHQKLCAMLGWLTGIMTPFFSCGGTNQMQEKHLSSKQLLEQCIAVCSS